MRQKLVFIRFAVAAFLLAAFSAQAQSSKASNDRQEAQAVLKKLQTAAQRLDYSGTFIYQQANQVRTSRITHIRNGNREIEKLEVLDGKQREYIRNNEEIIHYVPDDKTMFIEKRVTRDVFPAIVAANPAELAKYYIIRKGEPGRIAGYVSQSVELNPKDGLRYGYKLWAEKSTGLLLRAQTLNEKKEVIEQIAFAEISIGKIDRNRVKPSFGNTKDWRIENVVMNPVNLSKWEIKSVPPGFKKIREVKRVLFDSPNPAQNEQAMAAPSQREVSQIVFSDGLAAISVFIETGSPNRKEGSLQQGAMNIISKRQGEFWLTIVGEVPYLAIRQVASSIELKTNN